jgi:TonB family protein
VDEVAPDSTPIRLSPGPHIVAISAPQHVFYVDTVNIRSALELTFTPLLTPVGEPLRTQRGGTQTLGPVDTSVPTCDKPGPGYNKDQVCWDVRPLPVAPPRVPVPAAMTPLPGSVVLLVKVNVDGTTAEMATLRPSESEAFNGLANEYAATMRWRPASKDGVAVVAWTQVRLEAIHQ